MEDKRIMELFLNQLKNDERVCPVCESELVITSMLSIGACYYQCPECRREYYYRNGKLTQK